MTTLSMIQQLSNSILNLFFPPRCISCQATTHHFCHDCQQKVVYIQNPICRKCGYPQPASGKCYQCQKHHLQYLDVIRSVALYKQGPLKTAIHKFKYQNNRMVSQSFADLLATCYTKHLLKTEIIVPVPLHKSRYKERGYNQSALIAKDLAKLLNQPVDERTLIRHKITESQMTLDARTRKTNVARAFACQSDQLTNKIVLLIDDVCTTGATLDACAETLKQAGVRAVYGLTLARA